MASFREWLTEKFGTTAMIVVTLACDGIIFLSWIWITKAIDRLSPDTLPHSDSDPSASMFKSLADYSTLLLAVIHILRDIVGALKDLWKEIKK
jgi:hypothetical protein